MTNQTKQLDLEKRKQKALQRLGSTKPLCVLCGEADWRCLELHHIGQEDFDDTTGILCRNCHRKASDAQMAHPKPLNLSEPQMLERIGHVLLGLADFFELLIEKLRVFGNYLIGFAEQYIALKQPNTTLTEEN